MYTQMSRAVAIVNQKGGVAKTTTAWALGAGLRNKGYRVLHIDLDAQGNLTHTLGGNSQGLNIYHLLISGEDPAKAIQHTPNGDLIPYSPDLTGADTVIVGAGRHSRLKRVIAEIQPNYDYVIVDTPPSLGSLLINAVYAVSEALVPLQADLYSLQGVRQLSATLEGVKFHTGAEISIIGLLLTRYSPRTVLSRELADSLRETAKEYGTKVFKTAIRECIAIKEAQVRQQDIFSYAPRSNASRDYKAFIEEYLHGR